MSERQTALSQGLTTYVSSTVCKRTHNPCIRYSSNGRCVQCAAMSSGDERSRARKKEWSKAYWQKEDVKTRVKNRLAENKTAHRANRREYERKLAADPEYQKKRREYLKKYNAQPEVHSRKLERRRTPEAKERARITRQIYLQNPEKLAKRKEAVSRYKKENRSKVLADTRFRQALQKKRVPAWADRYEIERFYEEAKRLTQETGLSHHVDHIVPLRGRLVSGFHCQQNLRVVPASENLKKNNKWDADSDLI